VLTFYFNDSFGGGSLSDIKYVGSSEDAFQLILTDRNSFYDRFGGNSATNFSFPFKVEYTTALDPNGVVLKTLIGEYRLQML